MGSSGPVVVASSDGLADMLGEPVNTVSEVNPVDEVAAGEQNNTDAPGALDGHANPAGQATPVDAGSEPADVADVAEVAVQAGKQASALAVLTALGGKPSAIDLLRAHVETRDAEHRPQQEHMTTVVSDAIVNEHAILVQAGTGTGKSLAYLFAAAAADKRTIIATATNQLSAQLVNKDLPEVKATLDHISGNLTYAQLKGRAQYACRARIDEVQRLDDEGQRRGGNDDALFDLDVSMLDTKTAARKKDATELQAVLAWAKDTTTGDRAEAPAVSDRVWNQVSVSQEDCVGSRCPFFTSCFAEAARAKAREAKIVVTNHALLAQDIRRVYTREGHMTESTFDAHDVIVIDEAHAFTDAITSAFSADVDPSVLDRLLRKASPYMPVHTVKTKTGDDVNITRARTLTEELTTELDGLPNGPISTVPPKLREILNTLARTLMTIQSDLRTTARDAQEKGKPNRHATAYALGEQLDQIISSVTNAQQPTSQDVRWVSRDRNNAPTLRVAPILIGDVLAKGTTDRTLIATSATLATAGDFSPLATTLGLEHATTVDVGTPFEYRKQGILYIPTSATMPEPVGKDRYAHIAAVENEVIDLVRAAGGRTLALFTTTTSARKTADLLRDQFPDLTILATGDAPAEQLVGTFKTDETSVLCATMGMWHGVDAPGPSCTLVIVDKVAFAPVDDVLTAARRAAVDQAGRDGFGEIIVANAATSLAQAAGRLIRTQTDKGVVAILDPRIHTKGYGRTIMGTLPDFTRTTDREYVTAALTRLTGGYTPDPHAPAKPKRSTRTTKTNEAGTDTDVEAGKPKRRRAPRRASTTRGLNRPGKPSPTK